MWHLNRLKTLHIWCQWRGREWSHVQSVDGLCLPCCYGVSQAFLTLSAKSCPFSKMPQLNVLLFHLHPSSSLNKRSDQIHLRGNPHAAAAARECRPTSWHFVHLLKASPIRRHLAGTSAVIVPSRTLALPSLDWLLLAWTVHSGYSPHLYLSSPSCDIISSRLLITRHGYHAQWWQKTCDVCRDWLTRLIFGQETQGY